MIVTEAFRDQRIRVIFRMNMLIYGYILSIALYPHGIGKSF